MAVQSYLSLPGWVANTDLSAKQFYAVKAASTAGNVILCASTSDLAIGVLQNKPKAGYEAEIAFQGFCKALAGTSVGWNNGAKVGVDSTGKLQPTTADNRPVIGVYFKWANQGTVALNQVVTLILIGAPLRN